MVKLYRDARLTEPITDRKIHLGKVQVGTTVETYIYIVNDTVARLEDIILEVDPPVRGLTIKEIPSALEPAGFQQIIVVWKPPLTLKKALTVKLNIKGNEVYYA